MPARRNIIIIIIIIIIIAVDTLGVFNSLLKEIGLKISLNTGESRETSFL